MYAFFLLLCLLVLGECHATTSPTANPTTIHRLVFYTATSSLTSFDSYDKESADNRCSSTAVSQGIGNCANSRAMLSFNSYPVSGFPTAYGFSSSEAIYNEAGTVIASSWTSAFSGGGLTTSLTGAGLSCSNGGIVTGSSSSGSVQDNCNNFLVEFGAFYSLRIGSCSTTGPNWFSNSNINCFNHASYSMLCLCVKGDPTPSPTKNPTKNPTKKPTKNPTTNPTNAPTQPTASPTNSPTKNPTAHPILSEATTPIAYMIRNGTNIQSTNTLGNITYDAWADTTSPTNMTISLLDAAEAQAIKWTNVTYRVVNADTLLTTTETIDECNPIHNKIQGSTPLGLDGLPVCPTIYPCILTEDCTDNLSPVASSWPDLRACVCSYTITIRDNIPALRGDLNVTMVKIEASTTDDTTAATLTSLFSTIRCNSFIDRALNCQFPFLISQYTPQCADEPIKCYSGTLGYAFGAFWTSNPKFRYDQDRRNWTIDHYKGIASVMNNRIYYTPDGTQIIDPFTSKTWNEYNWINITDINTTSVLVEEGRSHYYQADIIQAQDYNWVSGVFPAPPTKNEGTDSVSLTDCLAGVIDTPQDFTPCHEFIWDNVEYRQFREPSYTEIIPVSATQFIYSVTLEITELFTSIEVLNANGFSCGKIMRPVVGETVVFVCLGSDGNDAKDGFLSVVFKGVSSIMDLVGMRLDQNTRPITNDPFTGLVDLFPWSNQTYINLVYPLLYLEGGYYEAQRLFPQRRPAEPDFTTTTYRLNYTETDAVGRATSAWSALTEQILLNNLYPWNSALATRSIDKGYVERDVNFTSDTDLDWLYRQWANSLAPRRCSDNTQCQTFGLGKCKYSTIGPKNYWRNGETNPTYTIPAGSDEGGCECSKSFTNKGFYSRELFCSTCIEGYGPSSIEQWSRIVQYNELVSVVFPEELYPFNQPLESLTPSEFEASIACRFPVDKDPVAASFTDFNMCSGRGLVDLIESDTDVNMRLFYEDGYIQTPACDSFVIGEDTYSLFEPTSIHNLQYLHGSSILTIINDALYLDNIPCSIETTQEHPGFRGLISCGTDEPLYIQCKNDVLFAEDDVTFNKGTFNVFSLYSYYFTYYS